MTNLPVAEADFTACAHCDSPETSWVRGAKIKDRLAYRRRQCRSCGRSYGVVIGALNNPALVDALLVYHDAAKAGDQLEEQEETE